MKWRVVDVEFDDPYMNMAVEEAIPLAVSRGLAPSTLRFWRNDNTIVIGRFQCAALEVNFHACRELGVSVVRRFTGGGAVYHDWGNLNYALSIRREEAARDLMEGFKLLGEAVSYGLKKVFGIDAEFVSINDLQIGGRKVSGMAGAIFKNALFLHGCILVSSDLAILGRVLNVPKEKLAEKKVTSAVKRVITVCEAAGRVVDVEEVKRAIRLGVEEAFGVELVDGELTVEERRLAEELYKGKYCSPEWSLGPCKFCSMKDRDLRIFEELTFKRRGAR